MSESVARWAISGCSSGLVATLAVALLMLPAQYYVPELAPSLASPGASSLVEPAALGSGWLDRALDFPPVDLFVTLSLLLTGMVVYLFEWIQRKTTERRLVKLKEYLNGSVERLRAWDGRQERLQTALRLAQSATSEYNLLLYLLLRRHRRHRRARPARRLDKGREAPQLAGSADI